MAVIRCTLDKGGKLKVVKVIQFQPGDTIELDEAVEVSWRIPSNTKPVISSFKCLAVKGCFSSNDSALPNVIPNPCPGN